MRREITRGALCLVLPLCLALGCDIGSTSDHGTTKEQLGDDGKDQPDACPRFVDEDGDGYFAADDTGCEGATPKWDSIPDCDDSDPERTWSETYFEDADGDGHGDPEGETRSYCYGDVIAGFVPNADDCAPSDPARTVELYLDEDRDGMGSELECPLTDSPKHTALGGDCDDSNPDVFGYNEELPLDGVDSDCNGDDAPLVACDESALIAVPAYETCSGVGLAILATSVCQGRCGGGTGTVAVVNIGTETSPAATLRLTNVHDGGIQHAEIPALEPGETYETPALDVYVEVLVDLLEGADNCAPEPSTRTHLMGNYNLC